MTTKTKKKQTVVVSLEWVAVGQTHVRLSDGRAFVVPGPTGIGWDIERGRPEAYEVGGVAYPNRVPAALAAAYTARTNANLCPGPVWPGGYTAHVAAYVRWFGEQSWDRTEVDTCLQLLGWVGVLDEDEIEWEMAAGKRGKGVVVPPEDIQDKLYEAI